MSRKITRPWRRGSLPVGVTGILVLIVVIGVVVVVQPAVLADPVVSAAATAVVGAAAGYFTKRALRSTTRLRWNLAR